MSLINKHQPKRPSHDESGLIPLQYRTRPDRTTYKCCDVKNQIVQMRLYRYCRSDVFVTAPAISELHDYLFYNDEWITKKSLGEVILQSMRVNPRKLKGKTKDNEKAAVMYVFHRPEELQYGLEWQICTWLRNFLNDTGAKGHAIVSGPDMMLEELDRMAFVSEREFEEMYINPIKMRQWSMPEPNWKAILGVHGTEPDLPFRAMDKKREPPRSMMAPKQASTELLEAGYAKF